jgi:hypothetical protein
MSRSEHGLMLPDRDKLRLLHENALQLLSVIEKTFGEFRLGEEHPTAACEPPSSDLVALHCEWAGLESVILDQSVPIGDRIAMLIRVSLRRGFGDAADPPEGTPTRPRSHERSGQ